MFVRVGIEESETRLPITLLQMIRKSIKYLFRLSTSFIEQGWWVAQVEKISSSKLSIALPETNGASSLHVVSRSKPLSKTKPAGCF